MMRGAVVGGLFLLTVLLLAVLHAALFEGQALAFLHEAVDRAGFWGPLAYILAMALLGAVFVPGLPFGLLGGLLFGLPWAPLWVWLGFWLGAHTAYGVARAGGGPLRRFMRRLVPDRMQKYEADDMKAIILVRFAPFIPFNMANALLAPTTRRLRDYSWGSGIGLVPDSVVLALAGAALGGPSATDDPRFWIVAGTALMALLVLAFLGFMAHARLKHHLED